MAYKFYLTYIWLFSQYWCIATIRGAASIAEIIYFLVIPRSLYAALIVNSHNHTISSPFKAMEIHAEGEGSCLTTHLLPHTAGLTDSSSGLRSSWRWRISRSRANSGSMLKVSRASWAASHRQWLALTSHMVQYGELLRVRIRVPE